VADARQARDNRAFVRGCSGQSSPASPPCSNWLSGTCRAENRQPSWGATGGSAIIACLSEGLGWPDLNIVHGL
jgi:hypothetical protein